jgi:hypothetical protein
MKTAFLLAALLLLSIPAHAQSTFLELGLFWGSFSGAQVTNATTTISDSKGAIIATALGAWPHVALPLAFDIYTVHVTAPATSSHPGLNYTAVLPLASAVPGTTFKVTSYAARFAFSSDGKTGTFSMSGAGSF